MSKSQEIPGKRVKIGKERERKCLQGRGEAVKESDMKLVSEKGENRRQERLKEKGERSREIVSENLRGFEGGFRESAQSRNLEKFGDLGGISEECRKSFRRVLEEFR